MSLKLPQGRVSSRGIQNPRALVVECVEGFEVQERPVFHDKDKVRGLLIVPCPLPNRVGTASSPRLWRLNPGSKRLRQLSQRCGQSADHPGRLIVDLDLATHVAC